MVKFTSCLEGPDKVWKQVMNENSTKLHVPYYEKMEENKDRKTTLLVHLHVPYYGKMAEIKDGKATL